MNPIVEELNSWLDRAIDLKRKAEEENNQESLNYYIGQIIAYQVAIGLAWGRCGD